jgi:hypothetical protein
MIIWITISQFFLFIGVIASCTERQFTCECSVLETDELNYYNVISNISPIRDQFLYQPCVLKVMKHSGQHKKVFGPIWISLYLFQIIIDNIFAIIQAGVSTCYNTKQHGSKYLAIFYKLKYKPEKRSHHTTVETLL